MKNTKTIITYPWLVVGILWVVAFLNYLDRILITSMRDPIVADFSLTDAQFGLLTSVFLWSYGFLSPFGGFFADKYSRKKVIVFSVFVWSAVTLWTGLSVSFHEMLVARLIMGISEACYIPAALALITDYHKGKTRSLATGLHMSGLYAGLALGGIGGYIAEWWGWRYGFQVFGVFGILYAILLLYVLKDSPKDPSGNSFNESSHDAPHNASYDASHSASHNASHDASGNVFSPELHRPVTLISTFRALFKERAFIILLIFFCILGMVNWLVNGWLPTFLKEHFHLSLGEAGISATGYIQIGSFIGVVLGGILADRWSALNAKARLYVIVIGFTMGAPFLFLMSSTAVFSIAIVAMFVFGLARGFNDANLMPVLRQIVDGKYIATGYGMLNFLSTIVGGVMVYAGGALKDAQVDLSVVFRFSAVLLLLATWLLFMIRLKKNN